MKFLKKDQIRAKCSLEEGVLTKYAFLAQEGGFLLIGEDENMRDEVVFTPVEGGYTVRRTVRNRTERTLRLQELALEISGLRLGEETEDFYYSVENLRLYENITLPVDFNRLTFASKEGARVVKERSKFVDNGAFSDRVNASPYLPFPAIVVGNYATDEGFACGSLSQECFYHSYLLSHGDGLRFCVYSAFKGIVYRELAAGETLVDEWYLGETKTDDFNRLFDGYTAQLRTRLQGRGRSQTNRHTLIWDSWNDGIYRDVSEEMLLKEAAAVKKYFPNVEWFQLDDGYASYCEKNVDLDAHGLGVPYEGEEGIDKVKFPNGLKGYTDKIKAMGLRPALWVGAFCPVKSRIYREKPDWFIDFFYRCDFAQPLDVSRGQVRDYMAFAMKKLVQEGGFEGVKHDFWSYAFEESRDNLSGKEKSGYEHRSWWQKTIVDLLPKDGYVETGCDIGMGNPFLGKYFNNYRFGLDVGAGKWDNLYTTLFWATGYLSTHSGDLFIPNSDSIGILPGLNDGDFAFWLNYVLVTRTMVELSGRFSKVRADDPRLKRLQKATCCINNGEDVYFENFVYRRAGKIAPEVLYLQSPYFARNVAPAARGFLPQRTVGIFNPSEETRTVSFSADGSLTDVWSGERLDGSGERSFVLSPHGSRLFTLLSGGQGIADSDLGMTDVAYADGLLSFAPLRFGEVEMQVKGSVGRVLLDGKPLSFTQEKARLKFLLPSRGRVEVKFL